MDTSACRRCGADLPPFALSCGRCGRATFRLRGRRERNGAFLGMVGSAVMAGQSAFMLAGGAVALLALGTFLRGDLTGATEQAGTAALLVGVTLLFDLLGVGLLAASLYGIAKAFRASSPFGSREHRRIAMHGLLASVALVLWVLVTLAWRIALAAVVSFYPTPFGFSFEDVRTDDIRVGAAIMLGLWTAAAFLLFLGALFGMRFLRRVQAAPLNVPRLLWPAETAIHFLAAAAIAVVVPGLLVRAVIELSALRAIQTLGVIDLLVVPVLGLLAYLFLFREFLALHRGAAALLPAAAPREASAPAEPPGDA